MLKYSRHKGFTLIELVIGIVAFAIVITLVTGLILPQASRSIDPIFQVRATELAQGLLSEINAKAFDESSNQSIGGSVRCNENIPVIDPVTRVETPPDTVLDDPGEFPCTLSRDLGNVEEVPPGSGNFVTETRDQFDDVDDFNGLSVSGAGIVNSLGEGISLGALNLYEGFQVQVSVFYDSNFDGINDDAGNTGTVSGNVKFIGVLVTTPNNDTLQFSSYRTNF
ncbi:type II secretion system protein [Alteromonadaceae bacterium M269]|nr:type II secretion system protein [Alteromonadaceae bacterium M269]